PARPGRAGSRRSILPLRVRRRTVATVRDRRRPAVAGGRASPLRSRATGRSCGAARSLPDHREVYRLESTRWVVLATYAGNEVVHAEPFAEVPLDMRRWWREPDGSSEERR